MGSDFFGFVLIFASLSLILGALTYAFFHFDKINHDEYIKKLMIYSFIWFILIMCFAWFIDPTHFINFKK